jgi:hypothetical protein
MMSDNPKVDTTDAEVSRLFEIVREALDWYDAVGPAEALRRVAIDKAALLWRYDNTHPCVGSA